MLLSDIASLVQVTVDGTTVTTPGLASMPSLPLKKIHSQT